MSNSANWFEKEYGKGVPVTLLMAYPPTNTVVMTRTKLEELDARLRAFAAVLASKSPETWTTIEVGKLLAIQRLDAGSLRALYCVPAKR